MGDSGPIVVVPGRPSVALSRTAEERAARFNVGSYGVSSIEGLIVGSVPHKRFQISGTPVMVVRA